jgi:hypothetical protein
MVSNTSVHSPWPFDSGPIVSQNTIWWEYVEDPTYLMVDRKERERKREQDIALKVTHPVTYILQPGSTS